MDLIHLPIGTRLIGNQFADVDAGDLGTDDRGELFNRDGFVGFGFVGGVPIARSLLAAQRRQELSPLRSNTILFCGIVPGFYSAAVTVSGFLAPAPYFWSI
jgi:hypothetical protein